MKIQIRINIFVFIILSLLGIPLAVAGHLFISQVIYESHKELLTAEIRSVQNEVTLAQKILEDSWTSNIHSYVMEAQGRLLRKLKKHTFHKTGFLFILDDHSQVVLHEDYTKGKIFDAIDFNAVSDEKDDIFYYNYQGKHYIGKSFKVPEWHWFVVLSISEEDVFVQRTQYLRFALIFGLIVFISVFLLSFIFTRQISQRIDNTLYYLKKMEMGDLDTRIPDVKEDEIGIIQQAINSMLIKRKLAESKLEKAIKEAEKAKIQADIANQTKSSFLANMSHELRTPLNGILGYAQVLSRDENLNSTQLEGLNIIQRSGEHLLTLINDVLDLSKIEAGRLELVPNEFHLPEFLNDIVAIFKMRAKQKGIDFIYEKLPPPLSLELETESAGKGKFPAVVRADEKRLRQILLNLIGNAVKFTEKGTVSFTVNYYDNRLRFDIEDTGKGIPIEEQIAIFLPFRQIKNQSSKIEGTGLGLPITQKLVESMGGEVKVESLPGTGSLFWFEIGLDVLKYEQEDVEEKIEKSRIIIGFEGESRKILVVDDKRINRAVLVDLLTPLGFKMIKSRNGISGLKKVIEQKPDLILTELFMPEMDGLEMTQKIRQIDEYKAIPIIAVSASVFDYHQQQSIEAGCSDFIPKPIQADVLFEHLQRHLNLKWIYKTKKENIIENQAINSNINNTAIQLSPKDASTIFDFGMEGDIEGILQQLEKLEQRNEHLRPFFDKIRKFAHNYDTEKICDSMEEFM